jgi:hypothetical protein
MRARSARSAGQEKRSETERRMGRRRDVRRGSEEGVAVSRRAMPAPAARRQRASERGVERVEIWSKERTQLWRARVRSSRTEEGMGVREAALGSTRERRMRAARDFPEEGGPWRMRMG